MKNETVTLSRELGGMTVDLLQDLRRGSAVERRLRAALAEPVPPTGGNPEIQRWSANWHMEDFYKSPHGNHVTYRDHRAHVTRLHAEVETERKFRLSAEGGWREANRVIAMQRERIDTLQSELTKAREQILSMRRELHALVPDGYSDPDANQSAPAAKDGE